MLADLATAFEQLAVQLRIAAEREKRLRDDARHRQHTRIGIRARAHAIAAGREPMPADAHAEFHAMVKREASKIARQGRARKIRDLANEGYPNAEIAARVGCSERTVTRTLNGEKR